MSAPAAPKQLFPDVKDYCEVRELLKAILFVSGRPLSLKYLSEATKLPEEVNECGYAAGCNTDAPWACRYPHYTRVHRIAGATTWALSSGIPMRQRRACNDTTTTKLEHPR